jgi:biopolymer transport protein ExbD
MAGKNFDPNDFGEGINEINITPFVDVVLVLLVIFMVTAPVMIKESLKVNLPKTLTSDITTKAASVGVAITKEGQVLFNGKLLSSDSLDQELKRLSKEAPETNFLISADIDTRHGDVVRMIDLLKRNNLNRFALQVEKVKDQVP